MPVPAIQVDQLFKTFKDVTAVDGISFSIPEGQMVALLGGNGAGKTTTLSMILGLLLPSSGQIHILGTDLLKHRYRLLPRMNFSSVYVELPHRLTVRENLTIYGKLYGVKKVKKKIDELAEALELTHLTKRAYGTLSAGQKTRVCLAKCLLNDPEILILDEPTASLDPDTGDRMRGYLEDYQKTTNATVLLASHNMSEVERLCDYVFMMRSGKIVDQGHPNDLIKNYGRQNLEQVFLDIARKED